MTHSSIEVNQMTHNTQVIKESDRDFSTILNVGRTNDGEIYLDIRVYHHGNVVDVGDITLTQEEWDTINSNLKQQNVELFICPECGNIVTKEDIIRDIESGSFGCCFCLYGNGSRILVRYEPYERDDFINTITDDEIRIIKRLRKLNVGDIVD